MELAVRLDDPTAIRLDRSYVGRTQKRDRPQCKARCGDGHRCGARVVWDKRHNRPAAAVCYFHGGWATLRALNQPRRFRCR